MKAEELRASQEGFSCRQMSVHVVRLKTIRPSLVILTINLPHFWTSGFGGLEVACWPLVPKFAGSNPAEAVEFLRINKILSTSGGMDVCLL